MLDKIATRVARYAGKERPVTTRVISLASGLFVFLVVFPVVLGLVGHLIAQSVAIPIPRYIELILGAASTGLGLVFLSWSISTFWVLGKGTPVPFVSPTHLVATGPFRYSRNPIWFGLILFYFGAGTLCDGLVTGLFMFALGLLIGAFYHKCIEEKELLLRYGDEYRAYRERTSFLIPTRPKRDKDAKC